MHPSSDFGQRIRAAQGYVELGMYHDANEELEEIAPEQRHRSEVLAIRVGIYCGLEKWELMQTAAARLVAEDPTNPQWCVSLAHAARRAQSVEAAKLILLEAVERIPKDAVLQYNLACYECLLGDVEVAKARLQRAFNLDPGLRLKALEDEDLETVWSDLEKR